jgi:hypothetical protein
MKHRPTSRRRRSSTRSALRARAGIRIGLHFAKPPQRSNLSSVTKRVKSRNQARFKRFQLYRMYRKSQLKLKNEVAVSSLEVSWIH